MQQWTSQAGEHTHIAARALTQLVHLPGTTAIAICKLVLVVAVAVGVLGVTAAYGFLRRYS